MTGAMNVEDMRRRPVQGLRPPALPAHPPALRGPSHLTTEERSTTELLADLHASRRRIIAAADEARRLVERDLHDGIQQHLVSLALELQRIRALVPEDQRDVHEGLSGAGSSVSRALEELRQITHGLHPAILTQAGVGAALRALARRSPLPVRLDVRVGRDLPEPVGSAAYYLVSEALTNAAKHARATDVRVVVAQTSQALQIAVADDGVGGARGGRGSGLVGMADRAEALGGRLELTSPSGEGTVVRVVLPIGASGEGVPPRGCRVTV